MKKNYIVLLLLLCNTVLFAQNNDFTNAGGDFLWSNTANWSLTTTPNTSETIRTSVTGSIVDADFTLFVIQNIFGTTNNVSIGGGGTGTLTIDAKVNNGFGIKNVSDSDVSLSFAGKVAINNSNPAPSNITLMRSENGNTNDVNDIVFESSSILTITTPLETRTGTGGDIFHFNGALEGIATLRFGAGTTNNFGSTSNNPNFGGDLVYVGSATVVANTADNNVFLPTGRKIQINATNGSVQVNGANTFQGNITVGGAHVFNVDMNKNQASMGVLVFSANGTLNLDIDNSVTELAFANNSESPWNSGILNITGFKNGVIRFGTDNTGLTAGQLSQIQATGVASFALDSNGYLIDAATASVGDFEENTINPIAYPTLASDKIYFKKLQNNVKIFDITGKVLVHNTTKDQTEITVETLASGMYFIIFDNKKVEKIIKQ
ncbi:T9SS type A sorting domain-containing protein [Polaribacter sp.]|uniref:T9SS type A sorting domain-containing protein n=1 Tax=Polaribacter sp. TaxID=1920175 RepID=UPI004047087B